MESLWESLHDIDPHTVLLVLEIVQISSCDRPYT